MAKKSNKKNKSTPDPISSGRIEIPTPQEMLEAGVHFGHHAKRWHPNMESYIYKKHSGIHVIDLYKTKEQLEKALSFLYKTARKGKKIIFVGTKDQCKETIRNEAVRAGALHVTERWFGGTLTNFEEIKKNRDRLVEQKRKLDAGDFDHLTKKERLLISREIEKLENNYGGIVGLNNLPGAIFIVDGKKEKTAVREAQDTNVPIVVLTDTNTDPSGIDYVIPGNDDAIKSVALMTRVVASAVKSGYEDLGKKGSKNAKDTKSKGKKRTKKTETVKKGKTKSPKKEPEKKTVKKPVKGQSESKPKKDAKKAPSKEVSVEDTVMEADVLSTRTQNALKAANVRTKAELLELGEDEIAEIDGIGAKGIKEINKFLNK